MEDPEHGDVRRYESVRFKCRCDDCRAANTAKARRYRRPTTPVQSAPGVADDYVKQLRAMELDGTLTRYCDSVLASYPPTKAVA